MCDKVKKTIGILVMLLMGILLIGCHEQEIDNGNSTDEKMILDTIRGYYEASIDAYHIQEEPEWAEWLDMESIQCRNKAEVYREKVALANYLLKKEVFNEKSEALALIDYTYELVSCEITGDTASVVVLIGHDEKDESLQHKSADRLCADNFFVTKGENTFFMVKRDGKWLISGHDYPGEPQYEVSKTELYQFDPEKLKEEWDKIYGQR